MSSSSVTSLGDSHSAHQAYAKMTKFFFGGIIEERSIKLPVKVREEAQQ